MLPRDRDPDERRSATAGDENSPREWREAGVRAPGHSASTAEAAAHSVVMLKMRGSTRVVNRVNHGPEYGVNLKKR